MSKDKTKKNISLKKKKKIDDLMPNTMFAG